MGSKAFIPVRPIRSRNVWAKSWGLRKRTCETHFRVFLRGFGPENRGASKNLPVGSQGLFSVLPIRSRNCKQTFGDVENECVRPIFTRKNTIFGPKTAVPQRIRRWAQLGSCRARKVAGKACDQICGVFENERVRSIFGLTPRPPRGGGRNL